MSTGEHPVFLYGTSAIGQTTCGTSESQERAALRPRRKRIGNPSQPERPGWPEKEVSGGGVCGQRPVAGLTGVRGAGARVPFRAAGACICGAACHRQTRRLHRSLRERRRLPGDTLIELGLGLGLGLAEEVPVRHRLGSLVPGGRSARGRDPGRARRLTGVSAVVPSRWGLGNR
jgi:hypothetical protein